MSISRRRADSDGKYRFTGLRPGVHFIFVDTGTKHGVARFDVKMGRARKINFNFSDGIVVDRAYYVNDQIVPRVPCFSP